MGFDAIPPRYDVDLRVPVVYGVDDEELGNDVEVKVGPGGAKTPHDGRRIRTSVHVVAPLQDGFGWRIWRPCAERWL
jgi:hypothetical protein